MPISYRPKAPLNVAMKILTPVYEYKRAVSQKTWSAPEDSPQFFGSLRTFGGSETIRNDMYTLVDTALIDTWYRPDIKADCRIYVCETGQEFDVISDPEDIDMRHQYLQFKVRKVGGHA